MKIKLKKENGITILSIIIAIIIIIILAAVSINIINKNNIVSVAEKASQNYIQTKSNKSKQLNDISSLIENSLINPQKPSTNIIENPVQQEPEQVEEKTYELDGESLENTYIYLFNDENVHKNFELSFTIDTVNEYVYRATLFNSAREKQDPYPGIVFRIDGSSDNPNKFLLQAHVNSETKIKKYFPVNDVQKVSIIRIDDIAYYSLNDEPYEFLADFSDLVYTFDIPVSFGGVINPDGTMERYFDGVITNAYVKILDDTVTTDDYTMALYENKMEFDGKNSSIFDTELYLFSAENIHKNFEIYFEIKKINSNSNQSTLMNAKDESGLNKVYPGFMMRIDNGKLLLKGDSTSSNSNKENFNYNDVESVRIIRISDVVYYSINEGQYKTLMDFSNIVRTFDAPLAFGGVIKPNGDKTRPFNGTLTNVSAEFISDDATLEDYQNALP